MLIKSILFTFKISSDLPNILFIEYQKELLNFNFLTTRFSGENNKSSSLYTLKSILINDDLNTTLGNINLFPNKIHNLQGREVALAIFNYMPYVLWTEVVRILYWCLIYLSKHFHFPERYRRRIQFTRKTFTNAASHRRHRILGFPRILQETQLLAFNIVGWVARFASRLRLIAWH